MIRFVNKYTIPVVSLPIEAFNCLDTETNMLIEGGSMQDEYYAYHIGEDTDRYQRVIALSFVDVCETDKEDDLSDLGFEYISHTVDGLKMWRKK